MPDATDRLAEITANIDGYIETKATEIATARITAAEDAAEEKVTSLMARHAAEVQRLEDLIAELRRQVKAFDKHLEGCPGTKGRKARTKAPRPGVVDLSVGHDRGLLLDAARAVIDGQRADTTHVQRKVRVGFVKAGRLLELLEQYAVIGPAPATKSGKRPVLVSASDKDVVLLRLGEEADVAGTARADIAAAAAAQLRDPVNCLHHNRAIANLLEGTTRRHNPWHDDCDECLWCGEPWPCPDLRDAAALAAVILGGLP
ncbi:hypothetical protein GCM10022254_09430 [Actinomadura meridiana]|uniref:FtsK gamma domain-containing protein n=1 Tax=Actinomadura meridiana TaxID=559626 RepID=A0ABP8BTZ6_9ACTN